MAGRSKQTEEEAERIDLGLVAGGRIGSLESGGGKWTSEKTRLCVQGRECDRGW